MIELRSFSLHGFRQIENESEDNDVILDDELVALNLLIFIEGQSKFGTVLEIVGFEKQKWTTDTCVVVGCNPEPDGLAKFKFGYANEVDPIEPASIEGYFDTPTRIVSVDMVEGDCLLQMPVKAERVCVKVC